MSPKRGFKAGAERLATEIRLELGVSQVDPMDPLELARHLAIPVLDLAEYGRLTGTERAARILLTTEREFFSAATVFHGQNRVIVRNERNAPTRRASDLAHELAHALLLHSPLPLIQGDGHRSYSKPDEEEADWLGAALLVPREGALELLEQGLTPEAVAGRFGVSPALCAWRLNKTGVLLQLSRRR